MLRYNLFKLGSISDSFRIILFFILIIRFVSYVHYIRFTLLLNYISLSLSLVESFACSAVI